jgi:hypothetical protein
MPVKGESPAPPPLVASCLLQLCCIAGFAAVLDGALYA